MLKYFLTFTLTLAIFAAAAKPEAVENPGPPPSLRNSKAQVFCSDCKDLKFDTATHKAILNGLLTNPYNEQLRKALYWQDMTLLQFQSKAHFDNCDFDNSIAYIDALISEVDALVMKGQGSEPGEAEDQNALDAFFKIGQALHAIQDFYAHSNYIELKAANVRNILEIPVVQVWTHDGAATVRDLTKAGLKSGYVYWGLPQNCPDGAESHSDLAKDRGTKGKGKEPVATIKGFTHHDAASALARESSRQFVIYALDRWPALKKKSDKYLAFEVLGDERHELDAKPAATSDGK